MLNQENSKLKKEIEKLKEDLAECNSELSWDSKVRFEILCSFSFGRAHFHFDSSRPSGPSCSATFIDSNVKYSLKLYFPILSGKIMGRRLRIWKQGQVCEMLKT